MHKLILVEGLPGTGKSSFSEAIADAYLSIKYYHEAAANHPVDFDMTAWVPLAQLESFTIAEECIVDRFEDGWFVRYENIPELQAFDIYEMPFAQHAALMLRRWERFAAKALAEDTVYLFDCALLQNPFTIGMISQNVPHEEIEAYIQSIAAIIQPLNPVVYYLSHQNVKQSFLDVYKERPEGWQHGFVAYYTERRYGKSLGLNGIDGTVTVLEERKRREVEVLGKLPISSVVIENERSERTPRELVEEYITVKSDLL
ncbi:hypothetical protein P6P90_13495 [Ectobacillus antri]|jgi:hypothetical protein|uniref:Uncharacterized protein n=1 Tax=Ectobacillus antri TaxID=2486280 RepID=A0ABT6H7M8_9BACI|nr:hypothetical protein [Ectobacillus antri]MDG4657944.1 hypothetical protein [Ectobacillus antri]MDG5754972.1 hypothetical protein [Ectobacillus antri]